MDVDDRLSPSLLEKVSSLGVLLNSFPQGAVASEKLLEFVLGSKRIGRVTERIGGERVEQRDVETRAYDERTLMEKDAGPKGVTPPACAAVMCDGGRHQRVEKNEDSKTHWYEYKAGICLSINGDASDRDPCPDVPAFLFDREHVETLTREIGQKAANVPDSEAAHLAEDALGVNLNAAPDSPSLEALLTIAAQNAASAPSRSRGLPLSPEVLRRDVVATLGNSRAFGRLLVARAWSLGLFQAARKGFVADGLNWNWSLFHQHFKPFGFVPILDLIHAVTYVYAAATAGRPLSESWPIYRRWITWVWNGQVSQVIVELAARQAELGPATDADGDTSPRRIVSDSLTYLQNQQSRMNYPEYRRLGLPLTSSHMESTIKELNQRIKGTEKFWSEEGGEAVLQLKADTLCDSQPLTAFWSNRLQTRTGFHSNVRRPRTPAI